ncbi:MAG: YdcF family protein [Bacteroidota bacterium]
MHRMVSMMSVYILSPFNWLIILLIAAYLVRNKRVKKMLWISSFCIFIIFSSPLLLSWFIAKWQAPRGVVAPGKVYSCGIVLGGFASVATDSFPYFNGAADRFIQVLKLYKLGSIKHILVSGGNGKDDNKNFREATFVKQELTIMGVPDSVIFTEDRSKNTADNARFSKAVLDSVHLPPPYLLITTATHMKRASLLFSKAGIKTDSYACNFSPGARKFSFDMLVPQLGVLTGWSGYIKEALGYWWYKNK